MIKLNNSRIVFTTARREKARMSSMGTTMADEIIWPKEDVTRIPYQVYLDEKIYEREQEKIFRGPTWNYVGLEAEIPNPGDYKSTFVGDTPVVLNRDHKGNLNCFVNRCSHKGATICMDACGNTRKFTCVYHAWTFNAQGDLEGVPFKNGINGKGGMAPDFEMKDYSLQKLKVESLNGLIFATFDHSLESVREYIGEEILRFTTRLFNGRPIRILGSQRQVVQANWKLFIENTKDPYHASLLHLFVTSFGIDRLTQKGAIAMDAKGRHHVSYAYGDAEKKDESYEKADLRTFQSEYTLSDPTLIKDWMEFEDGITLAINTIFPNLIVSQHRNVLSVRQVLPKAPDQFELVWTYFGYQDDTEEQIKMRVKQSNLVGPAGLISMEDTEVGELVQKAIVRDKHERSVLKMGGNDVGSADNRVTETSVRGFWKNYRELMGI
jgi:phenylpropionate dioxygenase-like ring-hydroxylating dioxygenase large terminal subunit